MNETNSTDGVMGTDHEADDDVMSNGSGSASSDTMSDGSGGADSDVMSDENDTNSHE